MLTGLVNTLRDAKVDDPFGKAKEVVGIKPTWIGYGYSTKSETSRMNKQQLAKKRAEADALKKKVLIPFGGDVSIEEINPNYVIEETNELKSENVVDGKVIQELSFSVALPRIVCLLTGSRSTP